MTKLFLDDVRMPPDETWDVVRDYDAFVDYITKYGVPDVISFDHDLAYAHYAHYHNPTLPLGAEKTGYDCAKYLLEHADVMPQKVLIHSWNHAGAIRICNLFSDHPETVVYVDRYPMRIGL